MFDSGMQNFDFDNGIYGNNNVIENDVDVNMMYSSGQNFGNTMTGVNTDGVQQRVVERTFVHEVPQECPFM